MDKRNPLLTNMKAKVEHLNSTIGMALRLANGEEVVLGSRSHGLPIHEMTIVWEADKRSDNLNKVLPELEKERDKLIGLIRRQEPYYEP